MQAYDEYRGLMDDLSKADQFTYQVWKYKNVSMELVTKANLSPDVGWF